MWKRIIIPSIPPFVSNAARVDFDDDVDADDEYDFVSELELGLERDVECDDFAFQFKEELEKDITSGGSFATTTALFNLPTQQLFNADNIDLCGLDENYDVGTHHNTSKRVRGKCRDGYELGDLFKSCWYRKFLAPDKDGIEGSRSRTRRLSGRDRQGVFRSTFRLTLDKVERLAQIMIEKKIILPTRRIKSAIAVKVKAELHVLGALSILGHGLPFAVVSTYSNISKEEHRLFFHKFIEYFFDNHQEYIYLPRDADELRSVSQKYREVGLPGAMGSKDIVHVKWSRAPAGDFNRCKGKE